MTDDGGLLSTRNNPRSSFIKGGGYYVLGRVVFEKGAKIQDSIWNRRPHQNRLIRHTRFRLKLVGGRSCQLDYECHEVGSLRKLNMAVEKALFGRWDEKRMTTMTISGLRPSLKGTDPNFTGSEKYQTGESSLDKPETRSHAHQSTLPFIDNSPEGIYQESGVSTVLWSIYDLLLDDLLTIP